MKYLRYVALLALLAMPLAYSQAAVVWRRSEQGSEWALELESAWLARPSALTAITRTIRMLARPTVTMVRAGSLAGSLSAQAPGTTAGDIRIMDAPTPAALSSSARL